MSAITQVQAPKLKPDFAHRLPAMGDEATPARLIDAVTDSADRATSVLHMLSGQYIGADTGTWSDKITFCVIEAAIREIEDMQSFVTAYADTFYSAPIVVR